MALENSVQKNKSGLLTNYVSDLARLNQRVNILMYEVAGLKQAHRELKKYVKRPWWDKLFLRVIK